VCAAWNKRINDYLSAKFDAAVAKVTDAGREPIRLKLLELKSATVPCKHIRCRHQGGMIIVRHDKRESTGGVWNHKVKLESKGFHHCMWVHDGHSRGSHSSPLLGGTCQCLCHSEVVADDLGVKKFIDANRRKQQEIAAEKKLESCKPTVDTAKMNRKRRISGDARCPSVVFTRGAEQTPEPGKIAVNGGWSQWTSWSLCIKNEMERERTCDSPAPKNGGHLCEGPDLQVGSCGHHYDTDPTMSLSAP
jgi:hypothetical protein